MKSGSQYLLETSGPDRACYGYPNEFKLSPESCHFVLYRPGLVLYSIYLTVFCFDLPLRASL